MSLLAHIVDWLVPFICGGVATVLGLMWRWGKAMVNGLRELLLCQLEDLRREMVIEHDGVAGRGPQITQSTPLRQLPQPGWQRARNRSQRGHPIRADSATTVLTHDRGPQTTIHPREKGNMVNNLKRHPKPSLPDELRPDVAPRNNRIQ